MRTGTWMAVILLALVLAVGAADAWITAGISQEYTAAAEAMLKAAKKQDWQDVLEQEETVLQSWQEKMEWLQMLVDHDALDDVTMALFSVRAAAETEDAAGAVMGCYQLREAAAHIHHRDAFSLGNLL